MAVGTRLVQEAGFGLVRVLEAHRLSRGPSLLPVEPPHEHLTSVVRLPAELASVLVEAVEALPDAGSHYVYPATDVHLTVLDLEGHRARPAERVRAASRVLGSTRSFPVVLRGFGVSRHSVYARAYDPTGDLRRLRERLAREADVRLPLPLRLLGFVNLLRFRHADVRQLASAAARLRLEPAAFRAASVELAWTDKLLSASGTELVRQVTLSNPGRRPGTDGG